MIATRRVFLASEGERFVGTVALEVGGIRRVPGEEMRDDVGGVVGGVALVDGANHERAQVSRIVDARRPDGERHYPVAPFTASMSCFSENGLGRKPNSSPSGRFLAKASSA